MDRAEAVPHGDDALVAGLAEVAPAGPRERLVVEVHLGGLERGERDVAERACVDGTVARRWRGGEEGTLQGTPVITLRRLLLVLRIKFRLADGPEFSRQRRCGAGGLPGFALPDCSSKRSELYAFFVADMHVFEICCRYAPDVDVLCDAIHLQLIWSPIPAERERESFAKCSHLSRNGLQDIILHRSSL